jgi:hypothetical protein
MSRQEFLVASSSWWLVFAPSSMTPLSSRTPVGVDLLSQTPPESDALYPTSMEGLWACQRSITSIEGDVYQAQQVWRALGGSSFDDTAKQETFVTRFVPQQKHHVILDRGFELKSRNPDIFKYNVKDLNQIAYSTLDSSKTIELVVVRRVVEPPTDQGFGVQELIRIQDGPTLRAALVKRRYRRSFDDQQNRIVEGIELVKTFRVLDGIAGTEYPTSVIKSQIRLTRPKGESLDLPSEAF